MKRRPIHIALVALAALAAVPQLAAGYSPPVYAGKWGSYGSGAGQFTSMRTIGCDAGGSVYVSGGDGRIEKFTSSGSYLLEWGSRGRGPSRFNGESGIAVDGSGFVYVSDERNDCVQKFTSLGVYVTQWGTSGVGDGQFDRANAIAVGSSGVVYVCDYWNQRVQKFNSAGSYLGKWSTNTGKGERPYGVAVGSTGDVFVLVGASLGAKVAVYTSSGSLIRSWDTYATCIALDAADRVLVTDVGSEGVRVYAADGTYLGFWGCQGSGNGQFQNPQGIATRGNDVYIVDASLYRVQRFSASSVAFHPSLNTVDWISLGAVVRFHLAYDNPSTEFPSLPLAGSLRPQLYGAFLPSLPVPVAEFSVPPLPPSAHFDIFADVPFDQLPPSAPLVLAGDGPLPGGACSPPAWSGGIELVWTEGEEPAQADRRSGELLVGPGAGFSYIGVHTGCTPTTGYTWSLRGASPGVTAALFEPDRVTPAPALLPPGWHGFIGVIADPSVLPGTQSCMSLLLQCDDLPATMQLCARACPWATTDVAPGLTSRDTGILGIAPNPASRAATVRFALAHEGRARLDVLDVAGRRVSTLWDGELPQGLQVRTWNGTGASGERLAAGTYFMRLRADGGESRSTIILTR